MSSLTRKFTRFAALAATAIAGAVAVADPAGILSLEVYSRDADVVFLAAEVAPELEGAPVTVTLSPEPGIELPVGETVLHAGRNMIVVPNLGMPGVYGLTPSRRDPSDGSEGAN